MPVDTPIGDLVRQLSRVGLRPDPRLTDQIVARGAEARDALLALATNVDALHSELPAALGPLHALRLLGELPDVTMIGPLLSVLPVPIYGEEDVPARLFAAEILQIIGRVGAPAMEALWALADDQAQGETQRAAAVQALSYVATFAPEVREAVLAEARARLADDAQPTEMRTGAAVILAELGDGESYRPIMAAYRSGTIDQSKAPAAAARQFLLGGGRKDLSCVSHPLWERYEQHGPNPRDEAE
jgi:hypothetical protein